MATLDFVANVNKTVTVEGIIYTLTAPEIPSNVHIYLNEVELKSGQAVELSENMTLTLSVDVPENKYITFNVDSFNTAKLNDVDVVNGQRVELTQSENTVQFVGATSIPPIAITGESINSFSVNQKEFTATDLPYTFTPVGGITNSVFVKGAGTVQPTLYLNGTNIQKATIDGSPVVLPYKQVITNDSVIVSVAGEIYQVDLTSEGGTLITQDGEIISDGNSKLHKIIDVTKDTYLRMDGTHNLSVTGEDIKSITVNGIKHSVEELPVTIKNNKMTATVEVQGYEPSEVHIVGQYMETVTIDGVDIPITDSGSVDVELTTREENHFVNIIGSQPRKYKLTWNNHNSTDILMDGKEQVNGTYTEIDKDVYIEATPNPIPIHIESPSDVQIEINGRDYYGNDITYNVSSDTEIDIYTETCELTIDYGDNSCSLVVPQGIITVTAPHRDGWIFDGWSSSNVGIENPKSVRTVLDLNNKKAANLVCHYQRYITCDKPNMWN